MVEVGVFKAMCIGVEVHGFSQLHVIAIVNTAKVPWHQVDGHPAAGQTSRHFKGLFVDADGAVIVDPAATLCTEQCLDVDHLRDLAADTIGAESFLHG